MANPVKKALFISIAILAAVAGGLAAYFWNQVTRLPSGYVPSAQTLPQEVGSADDLLTRNLVTAPDGSLTLTLTETEVNQVVLDAIAQAPHTAQLLTAAQGISTTLENDQIKSGLVVNLSDIPPEVLPLQGQQALSQLTERFPILAERDIYIGIQGSPRVEAGRVVLDDNTVVTLGRLQIPLADLANQIGLPQAQMEDHLAQALSQSGITLQDIQIEDGQVVLRGAAQ